ncbi:hypothetical protein AAGR22_08445 [Erwinia sp. HDF1-3R]
MAEKTSDHLFLAQRNNLFGSGQLLLKKGHSRYGKDDVLLLSNPLLQ